MVSYALSLSAERDLTGILIYTAESFGRRQAEQYNSDLTKIFTLLADSPGIGRPTDSVRKALRRHQHRGHVIFYIERTDHIEIARILPARADWQEYMNAVGFS